MVTCRRGWAGAFDITPDWMPILDESPVRGFWIATGMSGHGFKLSPAVGEMMALITGTAPPVNPAPFALGRFGAKGPSGTFVGAVGQDSPKVSWFGERRQSGKARPLVSDVSGHHGVIDARVAGRAPMRQISGEIGHLD